jgi:hypothetical protein
MALHIMGCLLDNRGEVCPLGLFFLTLLKWEDLGLSHGQRTYWCDTMMSDFLVHYAGGLITVCQYEGSLRSKLARLFSVRVSFRRHSVVEERYKKRKITGDVKFLEKLWTRTSAVLSSSCFDAYAWALGGIRSLESCIEQICGPVNRSDKPDTGMWKSVAGAAMCAGFINPKTFFQWLLKQCMLDMLPNTMAAKGLRIAKSRYCEFLAKKTKHDRASAPTYS